jgi:hypothetical protein
MLTVEEEDQAGQMRIGANEDSFGQIISNKRGLEEVGLPGIPFLVLFGL